MSGIGLSESGIPLSRALKIVRKYPDATRQAVMRTINKSLITLRKDTASLIRRTYVIKAGKAKESMRIQRTGAQRLKGDIQIVSAVVGLQNFNAKQLKRVQATSFRVRKSGGRKRIKKAFIITRNGKPIVVQRGPRNKRRLYRRATGAIASMVSANVDQLAPEYQVKVQIAFDRQIRFEFSKLHRRVR